MSAIVEHTGIKEFDEALSYLGGKGAPKVAKVGVRKMATVTAQGIRRFIPKRLKPNTFGSGIGSRALKGPAARAKAGVGVGQAGRAGRLNVVNRGVGSGKKFGKFARSGRKGVGISVTNMHWFALGTKDRFTGIKTRKFKVKEVKVLGVTVRRAGTRLKKIKTGNPIRYTGRIDKAKFGGWVQRGTTASRQTAIAAAAKAMNKALAREAGRGQGGVSVELGTDF